MLSARPFDSQTDVVPREDVGHPTGRVISGPRVQSDLDRRQPSPRLVLAAVALLSASGAACQKDDAGSCCRPISPDAAEVPVAEQGADGGIPRDKIQQHPLFDCERLVCTSYEGSEAFCTKECDDTHPCPEGLACELVVTSSSSAMPTFKPTQKWCVRRRCDDNNPCPEEFTCEPGNKDPAPSGVSYLRHCVRDEQRCAN